MKKNIPRTITTFLSITILITLTFASPGWAGWESHHNFVNVFVIRN